MKKYIKDFLQSDKGILIILTVFTGLATWFYISFTNPKNIQYKYEGIKYQIGNLQSVEPINIEINGKFVKELFGDFGEFVGTIKVGEKIFTDRPIRFNKYKMGIMKLNEEQYGMIFIGDIFEKLTIEIDEPNESGGYSWSGKNGWMISAPCSNRIEAVEISNELMQKLNKDLVVR